MRACPRALAHGIIAYGTPKADDQRHRHGGAFPALYWKLQSAGTSVSCTALKSPKSTTGIFLFKKNIGLSWSEIPTVSCTDIICIFYFIDFVIYSAPTLHHGY